MRIKSPRARWNWTWVWLLLAVLKAGAFEWDVSSRGDAGISEKKLAELKMNLERRNTKGFLLIRDDAIVMEWYVAPVSTNKGHYTASMAKALVGGMAVAVGLSDEKISLDDTVSKFVPEWRSEPRKKLITFRHLGSHSSGMEDAEEDGLPHNKLTGWKGDFWKRLPVPGDPFTLSRDKSAIVFPPGEKFQYSNPGIAMLGYGLTAAYAENEERDLRSLLKRRVMEPIGVLESEWSVGYGQTVPVNGLNLVAPWGGGNFTARASARVGRLVLKEGEWEGKPVLKKEAVQAVARDAGTPGHGGIGWWSNNEGFSESLPKDAFWAAGAEHQVLLVVPNWRLIAVRNGGPLSSGESYDEGLRRHFFEPLSACLAEGGTKRDDQSSGAYPRSEVITGVRWAPVETIVRKARGSDNWPLTWGDDGDLYTAYGDGNGFEPRTPEKLSLGLARIRGKPPAFEGINLRSPDVEQKGDGKNGKKASGMLMVRGVLYMWVRNTGNSQLVWSNDHSANWEWSEWKFEESFGCPTFLNFGRNYEGARDDYVYIYSHDAESAYLPADQFVMARVHLEKLRERSGYEFFQGLDNSGKPKWCKEIKERGAVFSSAGQCYRSGISYNAGLKRYLWCQTVPGEDPRFRGGLAIFEGPEPWGPWRSVFQTDEWDVGPGETSSFPSKWMSADGREVWLVFSGDDCFSVRRAELEVASP